MFAIRGKLSNGHSFNANVGGKNSAEALTTLQSKLSATEETKTLTIDTVTIKPADAGTFTIRAPRKAKTATPAAPEAAKPGKK